MSGSRDTASASSGTIYLLGGTTEANLVAGLLKDEGFKVVLSVATGLGEKMAAPRADLVEVGRKDAATMAAKAQSAAAGAIVDCTHPFAEFATEQARAAARLRHIPYLRFTREPQLPRGSEVTAVTSWEEAAAYVRESGLRPLLTIGVRNLEVFIATGLDLSVRVLPLRSSLEECERLGVAPENIIAAYPPYSVDFNRACISHTGAGILVSKDSGAEGGLPAKLEAAATEKIETLLVERPDELDAIHSAAELISALRRVMS